MTNEGSGEYNRVTMPRRIIITCMLAAACSLFSCSDPDTISLSREDLFTLTLGKMENQFDYFFDLRAGRSSRNDVFFDDGIFFIVNGNAEKLMQFSLFGELTMLLYNPAFTPTPVLLTPAVPGGTGHHIVSRRAIPVPFNAIGACGVDSAKNIYVEDEIDPPSGSRETMAVIPSGVSAFRKIIKRFDRTGNYLDFIGRTGVNGQPFPAIRDFHFTRRDHLVVTCLTQEGSIVYWLDEQKNPLYEVQFYTARLPNPAGADLIPTLGAIYPDHERPILYIMITYYANVRDESTRLVSRIAHIESRIYAFDLEKERYEPNPIVIPAETAERGDIFSQDKQKSPLPYSFLGVSEANQFFLLKMKNKTTYELLVLDREGRRRKRIRIFIDETSLVSAEFRISRRGLLYALIAENTCARIVRWRSDEAAGGS